MSARTSALSEADAKAAHLLKMSNVAKPIINPAPPWMLEVLSRFSFDVQRQFNIDKMWPTRKEMWDRLAHAGNLAFQLSDQLRNDFALRGFLSTTSAIDSDDSLESLSKALSDFGVRTANARRSAALVGKNGKPRSGASKALLPGVSATGWTRCSR